MKFYNYWWWIWSKFVNFGVDMSASIHIDNKKKDILYLEGDERKDQKVI